MNDLEDKFDNLKTSGIPMQASSAPAQSAAGGEATAGGASEAPQPPPIIEVP